MPWTRALLDQELEGVEELYKLLLNFLVNDDDLDGLTWGNSSSEVF